MYTEEFVAYLQKEKRMSKNTLEAYKRDVLGLIAFLESRGKHNVLETSSTDIVAYLHNLKGMEIGRAHV